MKQIYQQSDIFTYDVKVLAFDIETDDIVRSSVKDNNKNNIPNLGIICAETLTNDGQAIRWYGGMHTDSYNAKMASDEVVKLVDYLWEKMRAGYQITTWNGLSFDFQIVYGQSGRDARVKQMAMAHVDMMFHFFCMKGFAISLDKTAQGMGIEGKPEGMDGSLAPGMWKAGQFTEVLDYLALDASITLELAQKCAQEKEIRWLSAQGKPVKCQLKNGWLNVEEALKLPEPDTSWMNDPWQRIRFTKWM